MSHPSRVRELKRLTNGFEKTIYMSHPSRVRELKPSVADVEAFGDLVAPLPGA